MGFSLSLLSLSLHVCSWWWMCIHGTFRELRKLYLYLETFHPVFFFTYLNEYKCVLTFSFIKAIYYILTIPDNIFHQYYNRPTLKVTFVLHVSWSGIMINTVQIKNNSTVILLIVLFRREIKRKMQIISFHYSLYFFIGPVNII